MLAIRVATQWRCRPLRRIAVGHEGHGTAGRHDDDQRDRIGVEESLREPRQQEAAPDQFAARLGGASYAEIAARGQRGVCQTPAAR